MMRSNTRYTLMLLVAVAGGCGLDDGESKTSCNVQADCLAGFACLDSTCVATGDDRNPGAPDGGSGGGPLYGTVESLAPQSTGFAADNYESLVGATNAAGPLGCALVGDLAAAPGGAGAAVYAKIYSEGGDRRCLEGTFAIKNDPAECTPSFSEQLRAGCALYRRWDTNGTQVANQLAIGGYVTVNETYVNDMSSRCDVDLSLRFAGNVTVAKTFQFTFNPLAPASAFCAH